MKLIIDIDENVYIRLFDDYELRQEDLLEAGMEVRKGTPLPEGRLIDADKLRTEIHSRCDVCNDKDTAWCEHCCSVNDWEDYIDNAPTVIEGSKDE